MSRLHGFVVALAATVTLTASSGRAGDADTKAVAAKPASAVAEIGRPAPDFSLSDTDGKNHTLKQYLDAGKTVVLYWFNGNCPYIIRHFEKNRLFAGLFSTYGSRNVVFLAVNSTNPQHPQFGGDVERRKAWSIPHPILLDPTGAAGKAYAAKTTPHLFVITPDGVLRYSGAIDDDPQNEKGESEKVNYVAKALEETLAGKPVTVAETKPYGCGVKYAQ